jgi:hypothetical protein
MFAMWESLSAVNRIWAGLIVAVVVTAVCLWAYARWLRRFAAADVVKMLTEGQFIGSEEELVAAVVQQSTAIVSPEETRDRSGIRRLCTRDDATYAIRRYLKQGKLVTETTQGMTVYRYRG